MPRYAVLRPASLRRAPLTNRPPVTIKPAPPNTGRRRKSRAGEPSPQRLAMLRTVSPRGAVLTNRPPVTNKPAPPLFFTNDQRNPLPDRSA